MRPYSIDYRKRDGAASSGGWVSRGFWLHQVPRPLILCRLFGHKPVVDGYGPDRPGARASRWVVCDRCAVRPDPQGDLDPADWNVGDRYTGRRMMAVPTGYPQRRIHLGRLKQAAGGYPPGPWPRTATGTLGGQIVLGCRDPKIGFGLKVGNKGSEHTLSADVHLLWIGSLYLHTESIGAWAVRRFNPTGYHSRVIELDIWHGRLSWKLWAKRDEWSRKDPRWMQGSLQVDPRTLLLGPKRYDYTDHGDAVAEVVRMPHGDDHPVTLQLQRCALGRKRGRKKLSWAVNWEAPKGIPTKPTDRGRIYGSGVTVTDAAVAAGVWPSEAAVLIAADMTASRVRYDWSAPSGVGTPG